MTYNVKNCKIKIRNLLQLLNIFKRLISCHCDKLCDRWCKILERVIGGWIQKTSQLPSSLKTKLFGKALESVPSTSTVLPFVGFAVKSISANSRPVQRVPEAIFFLQTRIAIPQYFSQSYGAYQYIHVHVHTRTVNVCAMLMISYVILKYAPYDWLKCNPRLQKKKIAYRKAAAWVNHLCFGNNGSVW